MPRSKQEAMIQLALGSTTCAYGDMLRRMYWEDKV